MAILALGATGALVGALQRRLSRQRLRSLTIARVMEFQFRAGLATANTDGVVGPVTQGTIDAAGSHPSAPSGQVIVVDLINGRRRAFRSGALQHDFKPIIGRTAADPTTRDVSRSSRLFRHHTSSKFPIPPGNRDFSLFPSHRCGHVEPSKAEVIFRWAGGTDAMDGGAVNDVMVIVLKRTS